MKKQVAVYWLSIVTGVGEMACPIKSLIVVPTRME